jgi:hypothetical protein
MALLVFTGQSDYEAACQPLVRHLGRSMTTVALVVVDAFESFFSSCLPRLVEDWWADPEVESVSASIDGENVENSVRLNDLLRKRVSEHEFVVCTIRMIFSQEKRFVLVLANGARASALVRQSLGRPTVDFDFVSAQVSLTAAEAVTVLVAPPRRHTDGKKDVAMMIEWCLAIHKSKSNPNTPQHSALAEAAQFLVEGGVATCAEVTDAALALASAAAIPSIPIVPLSLSSSTASIGENYGGDRSPSSLRLRRKSGGGGLADDSLSPFPSAIFSPRIRSTAARSAELTDRLQYTQALRRMSLSTEEQFFFSKMMQLFATEMCSINRRQVASGVRAVEAMLDDLGTVLKERDDILSALIAAKQKEMAATFVMPSDHAGATSPLVTPRGGTYDLPTSLVGRRRNLSGASVGGGTSLLNDSLVSTPLRARSSTLMEPGAPRTHQLVPGGSKQLPEHHRQLLASGGSFEIDARRSQVEASKIPQMRVSAIQRESQLWRSFSTDLDEYKRMCAFELFLVGEPGAGKSSVAECLTHPVPRFFKKAPEVSGPTILSSTQHCVVSVTKAPQLSIPHGGVRFASAADSARQIRESSVVTATGAAISYGWRLTELPTPVFRAISKPATLPCKGVVYAVVYDLREQRDVARRAVESAAQHIIALATSTRAMASEPLYVPFILIGTHRDEIPELCNPEDQSPLLTLLREQRDWFESLLSAACPAPREGGPMLLLLDTFAVSCAQWTVVGERPQSSASFEAILHDTTRFLALSAPTNPQHMLPSAAFLLEEPCDSMHSFHSDQQSVDSTQKRHPNNVDTFWSQHGQNRSQSSSAVAAKTAPSAVLEEQVQRWLASSSIGAVTLMTSLQRCAEYNTGVCDSQTLTNAILQHFDLTVDQDQATEELLRIRNCIVEYFLGQCQQRGIIHRVVTSSSNDLRQEEGSGPELSVLCTLRLTWLLDGLSCVMLPATLQHHSDLPGCGLDLQGQHARVGNRTPARLLARASQLLGIGNLASDVGLLNMYKHGVLPLQLLQRMTSRHLRCAVASEATALVFVRSLGAGIGEASTASGLYPEAAKASSPSFFVPIVAKKASLSLLNVVGYAAQVVFDCILQRTIHVSCKPLNAVSSIAAHLLQQQVDGMTIFAFQNAVLVGAPMLWAVLAEDPDSYGTLKYVSAIRSDGQDAAEAALNNYFANVVSPAISAAVDGYDSPCVAFSAEDADGNDSEQAAAPLSWAEMESNLRTLVYQAASDALREPSATSDRVLGSLRRMYEHTVGPELSALMTALEELW